MIHGNLGNETSEYNASIQELFSKEAKGYIIGSNASIDKHKGTKKDYNIAVGASDFSEKYLLLTSQLFYAAVFFHLSSNQCFC